MTILRPSPVSTRQVTWTSMEVTSFIAEISDFGKSFQFGRVYDDACDVGLTLVSHVTGREIVFAVYNELTDGEGDIQGWELRSVAGCPPELKCTMIVYND